MLWLLAFLPMAAGGVALALPTGRRALLALLAAVALATTLVLVLLAAVAGWTGHLPWSATLALHAALTPLSTLVAALVPAVGLPVLVYAACREQAIGLPRLVGLLLVFSGGMELLVVAADLLTLLVGWEIVGACSWALIAHEWRAADKPRSAQYAFVATRIGDLGLFVAAFAAYAGAGSLAYDDLGRLDASHLQVVAFGVLLSAAAKSGQLPFSPWLFRAMAGPSSASALLHAATMVAAGAYLLARLEPVLSAVQGFGAAALALGAVTALAGGVVALLQADVKKVLAASTSAHFGLMFMAVGAGFPGVAALHLVAHGFFKALLFLAAGIAIDESGSHRLADMRVGRARPAVAGMAAIGAAALAGLPPLGAGWTKEAIVAAAAMTGPGWLAATVVAGGLSAAYAVRWLWLAYGWRDDEAADNKHSEPQAAKDDDKVADHKLSGSDSAQVTSAKSSPTDAPLVTASLGWLALASVLLSVLWWPAARSRMAAMLPLALPPESAWLAGSALVALAFGALAARWLAVKMPRLGQQGSAARVADWWGLPTLIDRALTAPVTTLAAALARIDDTVVDAIPRAIGRLGRHLAAGLAGIDRRVVDGGVRLATRFVEWLARFTSQVGELVADGIATGPARLVALSGEDARRLQTGLSHHAFAVLLLGALALGIVLLAIGR